MRPAEVWAPVNGQCERGYGFFGQYGDGSKPCSPVVHIKIAGLKWM